MRAGRPRRKGSIRRPCLGIDADWQQKGPRVSLEKLMGQAAPSARGGLGPGRLSLGREVWVDLDEGRCNEPGRVGPEKVQGRVDSNSSEGAASEKVQIGQGSAIVVTVGGLARGAVPALQRSDAAGAAAAIGGPPHQAPWPPVIIGGDEDVRRPSSDPHSQGSIEFLRGQVPQRRVSCQVAQGRGGHG